MKRGGRLQRRKPLRRVGNTSRLEKAADAGARRLALMLNGPRCARCDMSRFLEVHHVISRRVKSLRWLQQNLIAICSECHRWWHASPARGRAWFVEKYGQDRLGLLLEERKRVLR